MLQQAEMQTRSAAGGLEFSALQKLQKPAPVGYAIEARIYAEIPSRNFAPSPGLLQNVEWHAAEGVRIDTWITSGTNISPYYDPMIAKVIVYQEQSHDQAVESMLAALTKSKVQGCPTNIQYLAAIVDAEAFRKGDTTTAFLTSEAFRFTPCTIDVISAGTYTTVQDWPARLGVGHGIPEAGPMDSLSFRLANIIAGNSERTEGLEITLIGPELLFNVSAIIAVTGGTIDITVDGKPADMYTRLLVPAGSKVKLGTIKAGCRSYLAIRGGLPAIPLYLGSKSTTSTLGLGGYQGRQLAPNDSLDLDTRSEEWAAKHTSATIPSHLRLDKFFEKDWTLYVMPGPHDEPEFVTAQGT
jgi:urea carboxylase